MAGTEITGARANIYVEDVQYRAAVSEAVGSKIGSSINFINNYQYDSRGFFLNGGYGSYSGAQVGVDGAWGILFDVKLVGIFMFNLVAGVSGTTTLDVKRRTASGGSSTSIFSTKPSITSAAGNNAFVFNRTIDSTVLDNPAGTTLPIFGTTDLDAGDMLTLNIDAKQVSGENCGLVLYYRPR